jgi:hypothetical protein
MAESLRSMMAEEEPRQFTVRLNPVVAALFEAVAGRLNVSRNNAANLLLGSALVEAASAFPEDQREHLRKDLEKSLGRRLDLTPPPEPEMPGVLKSMIGDMVGVVEGIKDLFR